MAVLLVSALLAGGVLLGRWGGQIVKHEAPLSAKEARDRLTKLEKEVAGLNALHATVGELGARLASLGTLNQNIKDLTAQVTRLTESQERIINSQQRIARRVSVMRESVETLMDERTAEEMAERTIAREARRTERQTFNLHQQQQQRRGGVNYGDNAQTQGPTVGNDVHGDVDHRTGRLPNKQE